VATGNLSFSAGNFALAGVQKGTFTQTGGTLKLIFDSGVTNAEVNEIAQSIGYENSSNTISASVNIDWTFNDGVNSTKQSLATSTGQTRMQLQLLLS